MPMKTIPKPKTAPASSNGKTPKVVRLKPKAARATAARAHRTMKAEEWLLLVVTLDVTQRRAGAGKSQPPRIEQIERAAQKYSARPLGEAQDWCQTQKYLIQIGQNPKAPDAPTGFLGVSEAGIKAVRKDYQAALTDIRIRIDALTRNTRGADAEKASLRQLQGALQELEPWSRVSDAQDADDVETSVDGPAADDDEDDEL